MNEQVNEQEMRMRGYLMKMGYLDIIVSEEDIRTELDLPKGRGRCKCADGLGFWPNKSACRRIVIAESKGTNVRHALLQLGNVAAAVIHRHGLSVKLQVLLYVAGLRETEFGPSPGGGWLVSPTKVPGLNLLLRADSHETRLAHPECEVSELMHLNVFLRRLEVQVAVE